ncbi:MAG: hypothetical protein ABW321_29550 [Polyangiales bacterium]
MPRDPNAFYCIEVRKRPVNDDVGKYVADHVYLALLKGPSSHAIDTVSFDPSNSADGMTDALPDEHNDKEPVAMVKGDAEWEELKENFKALASHRDYQLSSHNCCHAVIEALAGTSFPNTRKAMEFAHTANKRWHQASNMRQRLTSYFNQAPRTDSSANLSPADYFRKKL